MNLQEKVMQAIMDAEPQQGAAAAIAIVLEEAAKVAENEEEPDPDIAPADIYEDDPISLVLGSVRATKKNIAAAIRALGQEIADK